MNYLKIIELQLSNIRCFDNHTINFTQGNNILVGQNGAGKSTILTAIGLALFGAKYLTRMSLSLNELITHGESTGKVVLLFETKSGNYKTELVIKEKGNNTWQAFRSDKGSWIVEASLATETQEYVSDLLGGYLDELSFKNALSSPQGQLTNLLDETAFQREQLIYKILGVEKYIHVAGHLNKVHKEFIQKLNSNYSQLDFLKSNTENPDDVITIIKETKASFNETKAEKDELDVEISENKKILDMWEEAIKQQNSLQTSLKHLSSDLKTKTNQLSKVQNEFDLKCDTLGLQERTHASLLHFSESLQNEISEYNLQISNLSKKLDQLSDAKTTLRTLEEQSNQITNNKELLLQKTKELFTSEKSYQESKRSLGTYRITLEKLTTKQTKLAERIKQMDTEVKAKTKDLEDIQQQTSEFTQTFEDQFQTPISELHSLVETTENRHEKIRIALEKINEQIPWLSTQIGETKAKITEIKQIITILSHSHSSDTQCPTCQQGLDGLDLESLKSSHMQKLENETNSIQMDQEKLSNLNKQKMILHEKKENLNASLESLRSFSTRYEDYQSWNAQADQLQSIIKENRNKIEERKAELSDLQEMKIEPLRVQITKIEKAHDKYSSFQQDITRIEEQEIQNSKNKKDTVNLIGSIDEKALQSRLTKAKSALELKSERSKLIDREIIPLEKSLNQLNGEIQELQTSISKTTKTLNSVPEVDEAKLSKLRDQQLKLVGKQGGLNEKLENLQNETLPTLTDLLKSSKLNLKQMDMLNHENENLVLASNKIKTIIRVLEMIPERLLLKISASVSHKMTEKVNAMLPNRGFNQINLTSKGDIEIHRYGNIVPVNRLSGGERTVVSLALRIALALHVAPLNFMILDEPTIYLDQERIDEFIEIVHQDNLFNQGQGQLLLVTHREEFAKTANQVIKVDISPSGKRRIRTS